MTEQKNPSGGQKCLVIVLTFIISAPIAIVLMLATNSLFPNMIAGQAWGGIILVILLGVNQSVQAFFRNRASTASASETAEGNQ